MGVPSPSDSCLVGDPAFTLCRRSGRLGVPFASLPHSLLGTHWREPLMPVEQRHLFQCHRFRYAARGVLFHRWKLGLSQCRFHLASRTCGALRYIPSRLAAFPTCYFPLRVSSPGRLGALRGGIVLDLLHLWMRSTKRRSGAPPQSTDLFFGKAVLG
jgi:hypothetical protein